MVPSGETVGTYGAPALARHIELQPNAKTPQYQQALAVVELNHTRNAEHVKKLRNEWRVFQQHSRLARRLKNASENAELKSKVDMLAEKLAGIEDRIAGHERRALEIENEIFTFNQPVPRRYVLRRMK